MDGWLVGRAGEKGMRKRRRSHAVHTSLRSCVHSGHSGFTLIELIVVMVILVMLAGTVTLMVVRRAGDARANRAKVDIQTLSNALEQYKLDNKDYPSSEQGLQALIEKPTSPPEPPNWSERYLKSKNLPKDPWNREYNYQYPGDHNTDGFDVWTLGRDNKDGGTGEDADANNWSE